MAVLYLALAAVFEVVFAVSMKASNGFTNPLASVVTVLGVIGGIGFLTLSMRSLPVSVAYPIWTGVGTLGTVALGALLFGESLSPAKLLSIVAILCGVAGLKIAG